MLQTVQQKLSSVSNLSPSVSLNQLILYNFILPAQSVH